MLLQNKNIQRRLVRLAIIIGLAALAEYLVIILLTETPILRLKVQGIIGVTLITYLVHTAYKIWLLVDNQFHINGAP